MVNCYIIDYTEEDSTSWSVFLVSGFSDPLCRLYYGQDSRRSARARRAWRRRSEDRG
jgi:hypothetical protein